ncbi:hypothetical protein CDAR_308081 [Caerostris darwini]|uniref:Uncharacterized protein n=1 Tax=Caerostris darwini TaxID=1538125 RepID=A0AAV4USW1_9ARAC|nr:hypothetical protein CDAR_308081 [Caerostris darwini]
MTCFLSWRHWGLKGKQNPACNPVAIFKGGCTASPEAQLFVLNKASVKNGRALWRGLLMGPSGVGRLVADDSEMRTPFEIARLRQISSSRSLGEIRQVLHRVGSRV